MPFLPSVPLCVLPCTPSSEWRVCGGGRHVAGLGWRRAARLRAQPGSGGKGTTATAPAKDGGVSSSASGAAGHRKPKPNILETSISLFKSHKLDGHQHFNPGGFLSDCYDSTQPGYRAGILKNVSLTFSKSNSPWLNLRQHDQCTWVRTVVSHTLYIPSTGRVWETTVLLNLPLI